MRALVHDDVRLLFTFQAEGEPGRRGGVGERVGEEAGAEGHRVRPACHERAAAAEHRRREIHQPVRERVGGTVKDGTFEAILQPSHPPPCRVDHPARCGLGGTLVAVEMGLPRLNGDPRRVGRERRR